MSEEYKDPAGGGERYEGDGPNLRYDDFVGRIVQDPKAPPNVLLLSGYLGSSSDEGHVRLYLDEELSRYVEIPEKAIRHTQELPAEQSPLGGSLVWIDREAEVLHGAAGTERRSATFLEGQIAHDYMGDPAQYGGTTATQTRDCGGGILPTDLGPGCGYTQPDFCLSDTKQVYCFNPRTKFAYCHTRTGIYCTRLGPGCGLTSYDPACTIYGQNCFTQLPAQCRSINGPCITRNEPHCVASGFYGCVTIDFTIYEQYGPQAPFAGGGGAQGFAALRPTLSNQRDCIASRNFCATDGPPLCTRAGCESVDIACPTQAGCFTRNNAPICQA
ncbi:MAG TPA: hypothetical protein VF521_01735, partial [Pyrinomonadaceae bacterium]